ncbi:MAG: tetratricopeptide repeat protein [Oscillospiraceae bacterium]|jgi:tetratricopeptide (TPR) repeat protein|nr:tetratricopeptide repeat protein [Oscillospiraceae bacterium]
MKHLHAPHRALSLLLALCLLLAAPAALAEALRQGNSLISPSRYKESMEGLPAAPALAAEDEDDLYELARSYALSDDPAPALPYLNQLIQGKTISQDNFYLWGYRGLVYNKLGRYEEAIADYTQYIPFVSDVAVPLVSRGDCYNLLGQYEQAVADYRKALTIEPDYRHAHESLAFALNNLGRFEESIEVCDETIALYPDSAQAHTWRGDALYALERYAEAIPDYLLSNEYATSTSTMAFNYWGLGFCYYHTFQDQKAIDALTYYIDAMGDQARMGAYGIRADLYLALSQFDKALADIDRALAVASDEEKASVEALKAEILAAQQEADGAPNSDSRVRITTKGRINVRAEGNADAKRIGMADPGDTFPYVETAASGWYGIRMPDGQTGYVSPKLAEIVK